MTIKQIQALSDYEQAFADQMAGLINLEELKKIVMEKTEIWRKERDKLLGEAELQNQLEIIDALARMKKRLFI